MKVILTSARVCHLKADFERYIT